MNKEIQEITKAQAAAVRSYLLESVGVEISHVQALEVIARGQGARSRHLLAQASHAAQAIPASDPRDTGPYTRVDFSYTDGANCKRHSQMVFRGRLLPKQLELIVDRLDQGEFFIPAQVGFESLHFAFMHAGEDHWWHKLEVADREDWVLDEDGYVKDAGGITQIRGAFDFATDADCDNFFYRFAMLEDWNEDLQYRAVTFDRFIERRNYPSGHQQKDADHLAWQFTQAGLPASTGLRLDVAERLLSMDFAGMGSSDNWRFHKRCVGPNAQQVVEVISRVRGRGKDGISLKVHVETVIGKKVLFEAPEIVFSLGASMHDVAAGLLSFSQVADEQKSRAKVHPGAYDEVFA